MNRKKVLGSIMTLGVVAAVVVMATNAFFSDTETSTDNFLQAGAIDLLIDNTSYGFDWNDPEVEDPQGVWGLNSNNSWEAGDLDDELFFSFDDLKPGDYGEDTISIRVNDNDAWACMAFNLTGTPENDLTEPEAEVDQTDGENEGELQNYLSFLFWWDDGDNVLEDGEELIEGLNGLPGDAFTGNWLAIAESGDVPLPGGETLFVGKGWCFGTIEATPVAQENYDGPTPGNTGFTCSGIGDQNDAQTDGVLVDVSFYAEQSRNNEEFLCSGLEPLGGAPVGAALSSYAIPTDNDCDQTADDQTSIQTAVDAANEGETVCVEDGTYNETVHITTQGLTLASLTGPNNTATIDGGVIIDAPKVTVTGFLVMPGDTEGSLAGFYLKEPADMAEISYNEIDASGDADARGIVNVTGTDLPNVWIHNNYIHGPGNTGSGIYTNPHTGMWIIEYNDIDDFLAGIGQWNGANLLYNEFEHSTLGSEAIGVDSTWDSNGGTVNFNNFLDDTKLNTYGAITGTIDAEDNFFSTDAATQVTEGGNDVDTDPEAGAAYPHQ